VDGILQLAKDLAAAIAGAHFKSDEADVHFLMITEDGWGGADKVAEGTVESLRVYRIIHPKGFFKIYWDFLLAIIIVYSMLTIPMELAFDKFPSVNEANYTVDVIFFVDILISLNTAYFSDNDEAYIVIRSRISAHYLRTTFMVDLLSCIPFDTIVEAYSGTQNNVKILQLLKIIRLLKLLKVAKVFNLVKIIYFIEDDLHISPLALSLGYTSMQVNMNIHICE
jgi:hypothetical protein